jgi:hypothetical protein
MKKHNIPQKVADVLKEIGETSQTATWDCHGTIVILHKALEKVAAHKKIVFDAPVVVESNVEKKMVVIVVAGRLGDKVEWSFGEAAPYNNKNSYPYAMAEKRAKDRVILKLVGLHGDAYSEDEADDFKESRPDLVKDDDKKVINEDQAIEIKKLVVVSGADEVKFLSHAKAKSIQHILAVDFERLKKNLQTKLEQKKQGENQ